MGQIFEREFKREKNLELARKAAERAVKPKNADKNKDKIAERLEAQLKDIEDKFFAQFPVEDEMQAQQQPNAEVAAEWKRGTNPSLYFAVDTKYMALGQEAQWAELCVIYKLHLNYLSRKLIQDVSLPAKPRDHPTDREDQPHRNTTLSSRSHNLDSRLSVPSQVRRHLTQKYTLTNLWA